MFRGVTSSYQLPITISSSFAMAINPDFQHYHHSSSDISQYISNLPYNQTSNYCSDSFSDFYFVVILDLNQDHLYTHINDNVSYI